MNVTEDANETAAVPSPEESGDSASPGHEELLRSVVQKMLVLPRLMRLAVKQVAAESQTSEIEGMGGGQHRALMVLHHEGPLRSGVLAERCHVSEPNISKMLKNMERAGLVERRTDPENRRVVWVSLTPSGKALSESMAARFHDRLAEILDHLSDSQLKDLATTLGHLESLVVSREAQAGVDPKDQVLIIVRDPNSLGDKA